MTATPSAKERIITAAFELSATRGLSGVTMSAVAEQAGVARQTLYNHFPDVESIVVAAYQHHHAESLTRLRQMLATTSDPLDKLVQFVRYQTAVMAHSHRSSLLETGLSPAAQRLVHEQHREVTDLVEGILGDGVTTGAFRQDLDIVTTAPLILHLLGAAGELAEAGVEVAVIAGAAEAMVLGGARGSGAR
jgi:AcrR family transcriptional regulator